VVFESGLVLVLLSRLLVSGINHIHFVSFQSLLQKGAAVLAQGLSALLSIFVQFALQATDQSLVINALGLEVGHLQLETITADLGCQSVS